MSSDAGSVASHPLFAFQFFSEQVSDATQLFRSVLQGLYLLSQCRLFGLFLTQNLIDILHFGSPV